ncbi:hypothetical protein MRX96_037584 [Rhipicephalus microplus]
MASDRYKLVCLILQVAAVTSRCSSSSSDVRVLPSQFPDSLGRVRLDRSCFSSFQFIIGVYHGHRLRTSMGLFLRRMARRSSDVYGISGGFKNDIPTALFHEKEHVYQVQHHSDDFEVLNVASSCASRERDWHVNACIGGKYIPFKVDTGSQANVLPLSMFPKIKMTTLMPSSAVVKSYAGNTIKHIGKVSVLIEIGGRKACAEFFVVKKNHNTILR